MEANKIMNANLLDIIFDGRNKEYGAYELRATYERRLTRALISTVMVCLLVVGINSIPKNMLIKKDAQLYVQDVELQDLKQEEKKQHYHHPHHPDRNHLRWKSPSSPLL